MYWESVGPRRFKLQTLGGFCGTYFYKSANNAMNYEILRNKHIHLFIRSLLISLPVIHLAHFIIFLIPICIFLFQRIPITPLALHLPIFEKDSQTEFIANMIVQTILAGYAYVGSMVIEISSCLINHAITVIPDLIQYNLDEFHVEFTCANQMTVKSISLLRNTFQQIQDFNQ